MVCFTAVYLILFGEVVSGAEVPSRTFFYNNMTILLSACLSASLCIFTVSFPWQVSSAVTDRTLCFCEFGTLQVSYNRAFHMRKRNRGIRT